jgi:zinc protease
VVGADPKAKAGDEGALALGLALLSRGSAGDEPASLLSRIREAGGRLELKELSYDAIALELVAPPADLPALLLTLVEALGHPAFASPSFPAAEFDAVMKDFRIRRLKEDGDPFLRATDRIRTEVYRDHPYAVPPLGTEASLLSLTREEVAASWKAGVGSERIAIAVVGDLDMEALVGLLSPPLQALGRRGPDQGRPPALPIKAGLLLEPVSGAQGAWLRADFSAPPESSPDFPALAVALAMLDDVLMEELRGKQPLAYGAWTRLSPAAAPSGSIIVSRALSAEAAKSAVERAIAVLAGGSCLALDGSGYAPIQAALDSYKARTLARLYERTAAASDMAERMARDLAAGGDGSAWFRLADRLATVRGGDLLRVFRERLVAGPVVWAVAAPEALLSPLKATH